LCGPDAQPAQKQSLEVNQAEAMPNGSGVGVVMAKGSGKSVGERLRGVADAALLAIGACSGPLKILCSEAAQRAAEKVAEAINKDGDPTNEVRVIVEIGAKSRLFNLRFFGLSVSALTTAAA
jgi:hypothetical protein